MDHQGQDMSIKLTKYFDTVQWSKKLWNKKTTFRNSNYEFKESNQYGTQ